VGEADDSSGGFSPWAQILESRETKSQSKEWLLTNNIEATFMADAARFGSAGLLFFGLAGEETTLSRAMSSVDVSSWCKEGRWWVG
jgi:hypothetical protein